VKADDVACHKTRIFPPAEAVYLMPRTVADSAVAVADRVNME
jgi:hypothetical protein